MYNRINLNQLVYKKKLCLEGNEVSFAPLWNLKLATCSYPSKVFSFLCVQLEKKLSLLLPSHSMAAVDYHMSRRQHRIRTPLYRELATNFWRLSDPCDSDLVEFYAPSFCMTKQFVIFTKTEFVVSFFKVTAFSFTLEHIK